MSIPLARGDKYETDCLICGGVGTFAFGKRQDGRTWLTCLKCKAEGLAGGKFMARYADHVGAPNGPTLLAFPQDYIAVESNHRTTRPPSDLPSSQRLQEYVAALRASRKARAYLRGRGLNRSTVRRRGLGYDRLADAVVIPVYADGALVNVRRRYLAPDHKPKIKGLRGRPAALYPAPPGRASRSVIVCAGEFDALVTAQNTGIFACTSTAGAGHWDADWDEHFAGKRVAVIFDRDEQEAAETRAADLPCEAWPVDISSLLTEGKDLSDYWHQGGTARRLVTHIKGGRSKR